MQTIIDEEYYNEKYNEYHYFQDSAQNQVVWLVRSEDNLKPQYIGTLYAHKDGNKIAYRVLDCNALLDHKNRESFIFEKFGDLEKLLKRFYELFEKENA